jgi:hypothetical protein
MHIAVDGRWEVACTHLDEKGLYVETAARLPIPRRHSCADVPIEDAAVK